MDLSFLGVGPAYPFRITAGTDNMAAGEALIEQSIDQILGTARGERVMRPTFGSGLPALVFRNNGAALAALAEYVVRDALTEFEPRITVMNVTAQADDAAVHIMVEYVINATNSARNRVFTQPIREGYEWHG